MTAPDYASDRHAEIGPYRVDLWRGIFRSEVRVWRSVWPTLGGLIVKRKVRHREADALFEHLVRTVEDVNGAARP